MTKVAGVFGLVASLALLLGGCADKAGGAIPYDVKTFTAPDAPMLTPLGSGYRIAPLDTLTIKVFKMPDLSGDYEVDLTGQVSLPLIGSVSVAELTTTEADLRLTEWTTCGGCASK